MHPVRTETLDLVGLTHTLTQGSTSATYPLQWAERTASGLHFGRAFQDHPQISWMERHVLPDLGLLVNRYTGTDWIARTRYYVDIASILPGESVWVTRDLYLDLVIHIDGKATILDTEEYLAAVEEHLLGTQEAAQALNALHRLANGVLAHGTLDAWLADEGLTLTWRDAATVTSGREGKISR